MAGRRSGVGAIARRAAWGIEPKQAETLRSSVAYRPPRDGTARTALTDTAASFEAGRAGPTAARYDLVHPSILYQFRELVEDLGGDVSVLLRRAGMMENALCHPHHRISYRQVVALMEDAAAALDRPDFGLRLAMRQTHVFDSPLVRAMRNCATLGEAFAFIADHNFAHSPSAVIWTRVRPERRAMMIGHDLVLEGLAPRSQVMEQILLAGCLIASDITRDRVRASAVYFRHGPISPLDTYCDAFGCEVHFESSVDAVVYDEAQLASPIIAPDPVVFDQAVAQIDATSAIRQPPLSTRVRGVMTHLLGGGQCSNEAVAAELHLHPRTLHRLLEQERTSFQELKNAVRRELLVHYLQQTRLDLGTIAVRLGFLEQSSMSHFCRKWFAAAPKALRESVRSRGYFALQ